MSDNKALVTQNARLPSTAIATASEQALPPGPYSELWNGAIGAAKKNAEFVVAHTGLLKARRDQADALSSLIDARIGVASRLANLQAVLIAIEADKQQQRWNNHHAHELQTVKSAYELELLEIRHHEAISRAREAHVIAERDHQAALRTRDTVVEQRDFEQAARRHNAAAEAQDAAADLARTAAPPAATTSRNEDVLNILEHEIAIQKNRDPHASRALQNLRSRIKGAQP